MTAELTLVVAPDERVSRRLREASIATRPGAAAAPIETRTADGPSEIQAKATIAAALIVSRAVEVPRIPHPSLQSPPDVAAIRLRDLTDYVYQVITHAKP